MAATQPGSTGGSMASRAQDLQAGVQPAVDRAASTAHDAIDRAASAATDTVGSLMDRGRQAMEVPQQWLTERSETIKRNPLQSVAMAAAAGFILGRLMR